MALSKIVGLELEFARNVVRAAILHVAEHGCRPDEDVGVPDCRHAVILVRLDGHEDAVILIDVLDGLHALGFRKREERALHRVLLVTEPQIDDGRAGTDQTGDCKSGPGSFGLL